MPRFNEIINNFINGEVSPRLYGRMDSEIYKRSCRTLKNMIVHPQGGASRRIGSKFSLRYVRVHDAPEALGAGSRIIPFNFSEDERYLIIFNKFQGSTFDENVVSYVRVDTGLENWAGMNNQIIDPVGTLASRTSTNLATPRTNDALQDTDVIAEMQYAQAGSYVIFAHEQFPPFCIARTAENILRIDGYFLQYQAAATTNFGPIPFMDLNLSDVTITASAVSVGTGITLTASAALFNAGHIGTMFAFQDSGTVGVAIITAFASTTSVTAEITRALPAAASSGTKNWYEAAWSTYRGWPRTVAFWNQALYFGGSPTFPDRLWRSQIGDIFEMANEDTQNPGATLTAADPFYGDLQTTPQGIAKINFMVPGTSDLIVGTHLREYAVSSFEAGNFEAKPQTGFGSEYRQAVIVDDVPIYVQRGFRKLREIVFEERTAGYVSPEVTFLAEHMPRLGQTEISAATSPKIKQIAYQALDNNLIWAIDNNGFLFSCTKSRENAVNAFHRHDVGGKVRSIAPLPSKDGTFDELYMIVERTIDSSTIYYLEKMSTDFYGASLNPAESTEALIPVFSDVSKILYRQDTPTFWAPLLADDDADIADGSATGTTTSTVTHALGRAAFASGGFITFDGTSNADFAQAGCVRVWASLGTGTIFSISKALSDADNLIRLRWGGSSNNELLLTINDSAGTAIINDVSFGEAVSTSSKGLHLIELDYDIATGGTRIFVDGTQLGSTNTSTGTRDTSIDYIRLNGNYDGNDMAAIEMRDFEIYDSVQNTANYEILEFASRGTTIYKLDHLEGEEVAVTADGNYIGDFTVTDGKVSAIGADYSDSTIIVVGKKYTHILEIQPVDLGSGIGTSMGSLKRIDRAVVRFNASAAAKVGPSTSDVEEIVFRDSATPADEAIALFTGDKDLRFLGNTRMDARAVITHDAPLPCNVTCLSLRGITADV